MHKDCGFIIVGERTKPLVDEEPDQYRVWAVDSNPEGLRAKVSTTVSLSDVCRVCP